jgi:hypothetical protein
MVIGAALGSLILGMVLGALGDMSGGKLAEWLYDAFSPARWELEDEYQTGSR